jgi:hypothetical protein
MYIFSDSTNPHPKRDVPDSLKKTPTPSIQSFFDESLGTRLPYPSFLPLQCSLVPRLKQILDFDIC